jgi:YD repeat-containing protein
MSDASGTTSYTYDPTTDRLTAKQTPFGTLSYTYDNAGDVTQIASSNANGSIVAYQYDKLNRLASVVVPGQSPTVYNYGTGGGPQLAQFQLWGGEPSQPQKRRKNKSVNLTPVFLNFYARNIGGGRGVRHAPPPIPC